MPRQQNNTGNLPLCHWQPSPETGSCAPQPGVSSSGDVAPSQRQLDPFFKDWRQRTKLVICGGDDLKFVEDPPEGPVGNPADGACHPVVRFLTGTLVNPVLSPQCEEAKATTPGPNAVIPCFHKPRHPAAAPRPRALKRCRYIACPQAAAVYGSEKFHKVTICFDDDQAEREKAVALSAEISHKRTCLWYGREDTWELRQDMKEDAEREEAERRARSCDSPILCFAPPESSSPSRPPTPHPSSELPLLSPALGRLPPRSFLDGLEACPDDDFRLPSPIQDVTDGEQQQQQQQQQEQQEQPPAITSAAAAPQQGPEPCPSAAPDPSWLPRGEYVCYGVSRSGPGDVPEHLYEIIHHESFDSWSPEPRSRDDLRAAAWPVSPSPALDEQERWRQRPVSPGTPEQRQRWGAIVCLGTPPQQQPEQPDEPEDVREQSA